MASVSMKDLLEAGVHFGHQTRRWNPKMKDYIFGARNGIYIIDLQKTVGKLRDALAFVSDLAASGGTVLFVGTKRQAQEVIAEEATRCGMYFVNQRWLGGTLTNFATIRKSLSRLRDLEEIAAGERVVTKKEAAQLEKERMRLDKTLSGIKALDRLPQALFIVDPHAEKIAVAEANKLGIPVVAIVDTNADPDVITVPIPGNDDAIRSVSLITKALCDVIVESRSQVPVRESADHDDAETYSTDGGSEGDPEAERRRRRTGARKRRPKPEAIAARLKHESGAAEPAPSGAGDAGA